MSGRKSERVGAVGPNIYSPPLLLGLMIHRGGGVGGTGMWGGDMVDTGRKRRVGVREEVGRARGRRELPEEGRGEWGVALGLRVREHGPPFAEATKGQEVVIQASRYTGAEAR